MKFWLIIFFLTPQGEFVGKQEIAYKNKATCQMAMSRVKSPKRNLSVQKVCVSDDHYNGRKQDPNVPYD